WGAARSLLVARDAVRRLGDAAVFDVADHAAENFRDPLRRAVARRLDLDRRSRKLDVARHLLAELRKPVDGQHGRVFTRLLRVLGPLIARTLRHTKLAFGPTLLWLHTGWIIFPDGGRTLAEEGSELWSKAIQVRQTKLQSSYR